MSQNPNSIPEPAPGRPSGCRRRGRRAFFVAASLGVVLLLGVGAFSALGHGRRAFFHGATTPEQAQKRVERVTTWVLDDLDATAEQRERVTAIVLAAAKDLRPIHEELRAGHHQVVELLTRPEIDRSALEALRAQQAQRIADATLRISKAVADAAEVLTVEQRVELAERLESHLGHLDR